MSNTPIHTANWGPTERRQHLRRRASAVAYLDIESGNGGIALDFSEGGMAFQAVGPLDSEPSVNLRIQLPDSRTRIKTTARVVWTRESNRQAGVRFLDLPPEARAQIQEWIQAQDSLIAAPEGIARSREAENQSTRQREPLVEPQKDRSLSAVKANEPESPRLDSKLTTEAPDEPAQEPAERNPPATLPTPIWTPRELGERDILPSAALWRKETTPQSPHYQQNAEPVTSPSFSQGGEDNPAIPIRTAPPAVAQTPTVVKSPAAPRTFAKPVHVDPGADLASVLNRSMPALRDVAKRKRAQKWVWIGVSLGLFSILCFGIGTWVGYLENRGHSVQGSTAPAPPAQIVEPPPLQPVIIRPAATASPLKAAREPRPATFSTARPELAKANPAPREQIGTPGTPAVVTNSAAPVPPVQREASPLTAAPSATPLLAVAPQEVGSAPTSVSDDSAATSAPRIVAGRILRPADRFNDSHLTYRVDPAYPPEAKRQQIEGAVKIHLFVGANGKVGNLQLLSGSPLLAPAAMEAAKLWQYLPGLLNGQPVATEQDIEINFQLPR